MEVKLGDMIIKEHTKEVYLIVRKYSVTDENITDFNTLETETEVHTYYRIQDPTHINKLDGHYHSVSIDDIKNQYRLANPAERLLYGR